MYLYQRRPPKLLAKYVAHRHSSLWIKYVPLHHKKPEPKQLIQGVFVTLFADHTLTCSHSISYSLKMVSGTYCTPAKCERSSRENRDGLKGRGDQDIKVQCRSIVPCTASCVGENYGTGIVTSALLRFGF
jgi:hypothetical protein